MSKRVAAENPAPRLRSVRARLMEVVDAVTGGIEEARVKAARLGREDVLPDLERIEAATRQLSSRVNDGPEDPSGHAPDETPQRSLALTSRWCHELRNPLHAIRGYAEIVLEDSEGSAPDIHDILRQLIASSDEALRLIEGLSADPLYSSGVAASPSGGASDSITEIVRSGSDATDHLDTGKDRAVILVVDDEESNREFLARRLSRDGHRVITASSGEQALALVETEPFDLVILDMVMPGMDGRAVLERLKANNRTRDMGVVMISAIDDFASAARCIESGAEDYLPKPHDPVLLTARINACLERRRWRSRERRFQKRLGKEKRRSELLLLQILPKAIVKRLGRGGGLIADRFDAVTVLFSDFVGFTRYAARVSPETLVRDLNRLFSAFDALAEQLGVEKIKTIGDAYMVVAGLPETRPDHAAAAARMALGMLEIVEMQSVELDEPLKIRIGIHSGPVVAGVIGKYKFVYDVWGDTVNKASRMESYSESNRIHVSGDTAKLLAPDFELASRGVNPIRGMGEVETYFLDGPRRGLQR